MSNGAAVKTGKFTRFKRQFSKKLSFGRDGSKSERESKTLFAADGKDPQKMGLHDMYEIATQRNLMLIISDLEQCLKAFGKRRKKKSFINSFNKDLGLVEDAIRTAYEQILQTKDDEGQIDLESDQRFCEAQTVITEILKGEKGEDGDDNDDGKKKELDEVVTPVIRSNGSGAVNATLRNTNVSSPSSISLNRNSALSTISTERNSMLSTISDRYSIIEPDDKRKTLLDDENISSSCLLINKVGSLSSKSLKSRRYARTSNTNKNQNRLSRQQDHISRRGHFINVDSDRSINTSGSHLFRKSGPTQSGKKIREIVERSSFPGSTSASQKIAKGIPIDVFPKNHETRLFLHQTLAKSSLFYPYLDKLHLFVDSMEEHVAATGDIIIREGDEGDFFYCLESGEVVFSKQGLELGYGEHGSSFGELALIFNGPRTASCTATQECILWKIDKLNFTSIVAVANSEKTDIYNAIKDIPLFTSFSPRNFIDLTGIIVEETFNNGDSIFMRNTPGVFFFVVIKGSIELTDNVTQEDMEFIEELPEGAAVNSSDAEVLNPGDYYGERFLISNELHEKSATAFGETSLLMISKENFVKMFGSRPDMLEKAVLRDLLPSISPYVEANPTLTKAIYDSLANNVVKKTLSGEQVFDSEVIVTFMNDCSCLVQMKNEYESSQKLYMSGQCIFNPKKIEFHQECNVLILDYTDARRVITHGGVERLLGVAKNKKDLQLGDIVGHNILGTGSFGKVFLVTNKNGDSTPYALKCMDKNFLVDNDMVEALWLERDIMGKIDHPFVVQLHGLFQDSHNVYMLLNCIECGDLDDIKNQHGGRIDQDSVNFYAACVLEALGHLHQFRIAHRDIKPGNIMIDKRGYAILVDFGLAKSMEDGASFTFCGSPLYMAPEFVKSKGHDHAVDYWALGVVIYELLTGRHPFIAENEMVLFSLILKSDYEQPQNLPPDTVDIIKNLLKKRRKRLGCITDGGVKEIKMHPYFKLMDWNALFDKEIIPPTIEEQKCFRPKLVQKQNSVLHHPKIMFGTETFQEPLSDDIQKQFDTFCDEGSSFICPG